MNGGEILVSVRSVYGEDRAYPANETAQLFARIAGTKTLLPATLAYAKALGYHVAFVAPRSRFEGFGA